MSIKISDNRARALIAKAIEIEAVGAKDAGELGFMPRILVQTSLPYRDPKAQVYTRINGSVKLTMMSPNGVPYGSIPRSLINYLASEAVRTKSPFISLGRSQNDFTRLLGMGTAGGAQKDRMKTQCKRFFTTVLSVEVSNTLKNGTIQEAIESVLVAKKAFIFWNPHSEPMQWESSIELTQDFFQECITRPIPVDMRVMDVLSTSPFAMDVYVWLTWRVAKARHASTLPWEYLMLHFGFVDGTEVRTFRRHFMHALKQVMTAASWHPSITVDDKTGLTIYPGKGHVLHVNKRA